MDDNTVKVWRIALERPDGNDDGPEILSREELDQAARLTSPRAAQRFIRCHRGVRHILGRQLGVPPADLAFDRSSDGKPSLVGQASSADVRFNLAHSESLALLAVTRGQEVGIDVERIRADFDWRPLARYVLQAQEIEAILSADGGSRQAAAFYAYWTRKEAYLKALGVGLTRPPEAFRVVPTQRPGLHTVEIPTPDSAAARWVLDLAVAPGYAAALAAEQPNLSVDLRDYPSGPLPHPCS